MTPGARARAMAANLLAAVRRRPLPYAAAGLAALLLLWPSTSATPAGGAAGQIATGADIVGAVLKTVAVCLFALMALKLLRRAGVGTPTEGDGLLRVIETKGIGPRLQVSLIAVGDRRLIVGVSAGSITPIAEFDAAELEPAAAAIADAAPAAPPAEFEELLRRLSERR